MAKNSIARPTAATQIVQIALLPELVEEALSEKIPLQDLLQAVTDILPQGYSLTIGYDMDTAKYSARYAGIDKASPNAGKLLYANGRTVEQALLGLYIKHFLQSKGGNWEATVRTSSDMS